MLYINVASKSLFYTNLIITIVSFISSETKNYNNIVPGTVIDDNIIKEEENTTIEKNFFY